MNHKLGILILGDMFLHIEGRQIQEIQEIRETKDQQVKPPFPENVVDEEEEIDPLENEIHHFDIVEFELYLTKEEHNMFSQEEDYNSFELCHVHTF